jgi:hypothetical protein
LGGGVLDGVETFQLVVAESEHLAGDLKHERLEVGYGLLLVTLHAGSLSSSFS